MAKFVPVSVNGILFTGFACTGVLFGAMLVSVGTPPVTTNFNPLLVPLLGVFTEISGVPIVNKLVGTVPDKLVSDAVPVAASAVDPNIIVPLVNPLPVTVSVSEAPPVPAVVGESEIMWGPVPNEKLFSTIPHTPRPWVAALS